MPLTRFWLALLVITSAHFSFVTLARRVNAEDQAKPAQSTTSLTFANDSSWKPSQFGGDGKIKMTDGVLSLGFGDPLTGVRWTGDFPKLNYEVSLEARRVGGFDFFCGLTLPLGEERFSLVIGGWGGSLVGLSSIDGMDASNNETMLIRDFKKDQWYKVRVRATKEKVIVWFDGDEIINFDRAGHVFDIRSEMEESVPVGIAAYQCESEVRNMNVRVLTDAESAAASKAVEPASKP